MNDLTKQSAIEEMIFTIRGQKVMLDRDLAHLYRVSTKALNQAVKRNKQRFPDDFMFRLTNKEKNELVTNCDRFEKLKHSSVNPWAFPEQGVAMMATVLSSEQAIHTSLVIIRVFVRMRQAVASHKELTERLTLLEQRMESKDTEVKYIFKAIRQLMVIPKKEKKKIGFMR